MQWHRKLLPTSITIKRGHMRIKTHVNMCVYRKCVGTRRELCHASDSMRLYSAANRYIVFMVHVYSFNARLYT